MPESARRSASSYARNVLQLVRSIYNWGTAIAARRTRDAIMAVTLGYAPASWTFHDIRQRCGRGSRPSAYGTRSPSSPLVMPGTASKRRLAGDTARSATTNEVKDLRRAAP